MEKIIATIKLMAKTGLFFAHCDGNYSDHEYRFINGFLEGILEVGDIEDSLKEEIKDSVNHTYTIDGIIEETANIVNGFNEDERKAILFIISQFILKVIVADDSIADEEKANFEKWKAAFNL